MTDQPVLSTALSVAEPHSSATPPAENVEEVTDMLTLIFGHILNPQE